jgi:hypothetical protein
VVEGVRNTLGTPRRLEAAVVGTPDIQEVYALVVVVVGTLRTVGLMGSPVAVVEDMDIRTLMLFTFSPKLIEKQSIRILIKTINSKINV